MLLAQNDEEWEKLLSMDPSETPGIVRNMDDWKMLIESDENPLKGCDEDIIAKFTESLKFEGGGFAHADYSPLDEILSHARFMDLWARFGIGLGVFADHDGYSCTGRATCTSTERSICTTNC